MPDLHHMLVYRAVTGAVKNVIDGHPNWQIPRGFAMSVAKRAAGTLMAHAAPEALASARTSSKARRRLTIRRPASGGAVLEKTAAVGAPHVESGRAHLHRCAVAIGKMAKEAKLAGNMVTYHSLVDALRIIGVEMELMKADGA